MVARAGKGDLLAEPCDNEPAFGAPADGHCWCVVIPRS
jgi:hypothetical protein